MPRHVRNGARGLAGDGFRDGRNMLRCRAAAPADDIDQSRFGEFAQEIRHIGGALVIVAELVRQAGVRVGAHKGVGQPAQLRDMRAHLTRTERAIEPDGDGPGVFHRIPERARRLPRQQAAGAIGNGPGNHHGHVKAAFVANLGDREDGGLGIERVENGFDQQQVGTAIDQPAHLLAVGRAQLIESDRAETGIGNVGGN